MECVCVCRLAGSHVHVQGQQGLTFTCVAGVLQGKADAVRDWEGKAGKLEETAVVLAQNITDKTQDAAEHRQRSMEVSRLQ